MPTVNTLKKSDITHTVVVRGPWRGKNYTKETILMSFTSQGDAEAYANELVAKEVGPLSESAWGWSTTNEKEGWTIAVRYDTSAIHGAARKLEVSHAEVGIACQIASLNQGPLTPKKATALLRGVQALAAELEKP
ncbi:MAG: hypothetical protein IPF92_19300 [Myxococcales bacterium]|nr:hypothetical protein [Myxococcales bacterium]